MTWKTEDCEAVKLHFHEDCVGLGLFSTDKERQEFLGCVVQSLQRVANALQEY